MSLLQSLNWTDVRRHYDERVAVHRELMELHRNGRVGDFAPLLLGMSNSAGNYSAEEHSLGPRILAANRNAEQRIFDLAARFMVLKKAREVPALIRGAGLQHLAIGVGSEASCMVNPQVCWVANTRTLWAHLVIKHDDDIKRAEEELRLYRDSDETSEMAYAKWADIHTTLEVALTRLGEDGAKQARLAAVEPGPIVYLWADAIAAYLYASHRGYAGVLRRRA
jgi:hypothetical protein